MKSTGMVRNLDNLGRVVLPKELRTTLDIEIKDPLEIFVDENKIILKKYTPGCVFCGDASKVTSYKGNNVCGSCIQDMKR